MDANEKHKARTELDDHEFFANDGSAKLPDHWVEQLKKINKNVKPLDIALKHIRKLYKDSDYEQKKDDY